MAVKKNLNINSADYIVSGTEIRLTGVIVNTVNRDGYFTKNSRGTTVISSHEVLQSGLEFTKREELVFEGPVTIELVPDSKFEETNYGVTTSFDDVGAKLVNDKTLGNKSNIYYSINGKSPQKSKHNLYTGAFTVRKNSTGSDETVLKVKTYVDGRASKTRTVRFRINRITKMSF
jgi:hypothetical protein